MEKLNHTNKLLFVKLSNLKIYNKNKNTVIKTDVNFKKNHILLKKLLHLMFQYHVNRKKILIITQKNILTEEQKIYYSKFFSFIMPRSAWVNGSLSNPKNAIKNISKNKLCFEILKKPDLIILSNYCELINTEQYNRKIVNLTLNNPSKKLKLSYLDYNFSSVNLNKSVERIEKFILVLFEKISKLPKTLISKHFHYKKKKPVFKTKTKTIF